MIIESYNQIALNGSFSNPRGNIIFHSIAAATNNTNREQRAMSPNSQL